MLSEPPLLGVGPGGFQQAYLSHKPPENPEEVADPHNVFIAYTATLGLGGLAWSILLIGLLGRAGRRDLASTDPLSAPDTGNAGHDLPPGLRWAATLAAGGLIFITAYLRELAFLGLTGLLVAGLGCQIQFVAWRAQREQRSGWAIGLVLAALGTPMALLSPVGVWWAGMVGFIGIMGWLSGREELDTHPVRLGLFAAAAALLAHGQIEMSLTNTMAAPLLGALLGLAAADPAEPAPAPRFRWLRWSAAALIPLALIAMLVWHTPWILRDQATKAEAARALRQAGQNPIATARARSAAIELMPPADQYPPDAERSIHAAKLLMEQATEHHRAGRTDQRDEALNRALRRLHRARSTGQIFARLWRLELKLCQRAATRTKASAWRSRAFEAAGELVRHDPHSLRSHLLAADAAWEAERFEAAERWYRRTLKLNEAAYLDPIKQLNDRQRRRIRSRLDREAAVGAAPP
jgi:tetratricopeptide (TPR) repeat protein